MDNIDGLRGFPQKDSDEGRKKNISRSRVYTNGRIGAELRLMTGCWGRWQAGTSLWAALVQAQSGCYMFYTTNS
jgi:hypothetical protein